GFAKNFLVPEGKAVLASEAKIREVEHLKRQIAETVAKQLADHRKAKQALEAIQLEIKAKVGEEGGRCGQEREQGQGRRGGRGVRLGAGRAGGRAPRRGGGRDRPAPDRARADQ